MPSGVYIKTEEHKRKISEALKGRGLGENNGNWKGNKAGYLAIHTWVRRHKPKPVLCEICGKEGKLQLSNISGDYKRDINDFQYLHAKCHKKYDIENNFYGKTKIKYNKDVI